MSLPGVFLFSHYVESFWVSLLPIIKKKKYSLYTRFPIYGRYALIFLIFNKVYVVMYQASKHVGNYFFALNS